MDLILIRHAEAEAGAGKPDADRELTEVGHQQAARLAEALVRRHRPAVVATSPLVRAVQTAAPLAAGLDKFETDLLANEGYKPKKLTAYLTDLGDGPVVAVGHNPSISQYLAWLLGADEAATPFEKAAAACVRLDKRERGGGRLVWLVTPDWC
jgi:phosphohistidine phosphatase